MSNIPDWIRSHDSTKPLAWWTVENADDRVAAAVVLHVYAPDKEADLRAIREQQQAQGGIVHDISRPTDTTLRLEFRALTGEFICGIDVEVVPADWPQAERQARMRGKSELMVMITADPAALQGSGDIDYVQVAIDIAQLSEAERRVDRTLRRVRLAADPATGVSPLTEELAQQLTAVYGPEVVQDLRRGEQEQPPLSRQQRRELERLQAKAAAQRQRG